MCKKLISVVVPVFKVEKYIDRCIKSILNQTFINFELLLIDDGSPDNCPAICDEYQKKDSRVRVIHQDNKGLAGARNTGIENASTEWILFVDSDDFIHKQTVEFLYKAVVKDKTDIAVCGRLSEREFDNSFYRTRSFESTVIEICQDSLIKMYTSKQRSISNIYWLVYPKLIKRKIAEKFPFTEGRIFEDNALNYKWLNEAGKISVIDEDLYYYTDNPAGIMRSDFSIKKLDFLWALEQQVEYYYSIGYMSLLRMVIIDYYNNVVYFGKRIINELNDEALCRQLMREAEKKQKTFSKYCSFDLDYSTRNFIMKYSHPNIFRLKKKIQHLKSFVKTRG